MNRSSLAYITRVMLALAGLFGGVVASDCLNGQRQEPARSSFGTQPNDTLDRLHPRYFARIAEVKPNGDTVWIFTQETRTRAPAIYSNYEVDRRSRLLVTFDRNWMSEQPNLMADILVTGQVINDKGSQDIEVPGYQEIGKQTQTNPVRVRPITESRTALAEYRNAGNPIWGVLASLSGWRTTAGSDANYINLSNQLQ